MRAGGHVDRVVAHAEAADGQQVFRLGNALGGYGRRQHDHPLGVCDLVGTDLGSMLGKGATFDVAVAVEDRQAQVPVFRTSVGAEEIGRHGHDELFADLAAHGPLSRYFQGFPSAVPQRSATTNRSGAGPP